VPPRSFQVNVGKCGLGYAVGLKTKQLDSAVSLSRDLSPGLQGLDSVLVLVLVSVAVLVPVSLQRLNSVLVSLSVAVLVPVANSQILS